MLLLLTKASVLRRKRSRVLVNRLLRTRCRRLWTRSSVHKQRTSSQTCCPELSIVALREKLAARCVALLSPEKQERLETDGLLVTRRTSFVLSGSVLTTTSSLV